MPKKISKNMRQNFILLQFTYFFHGIMKAAEKLIWDFKWEMVFLVKFIEDFVNFLFTHFGVFRVFYINRIPKLHFFIFGDICICNILCKKTNETNCCLCGFPFGSPSKFDYHLLSHLH